MTWFNSPDRLKSETKKNPDAKNTIVDIISDRAFIGGTFKN